VGACCTHHELVPPTTDVRPRPVDVVNDNKFETPPTPTLYPKSRSPESMVREEVGYIWGVGASATVSRGKQAELKPCDAQVDLQIKDMSRNVAKKLSLMIDLMMSLSDQVGSVSGVPNASRGSGSQYPGDGNPGALMPALR
jgi:hypothetical protein